MARRYARGSRAVGICARSGRKMLLRDMVFDGLYPDLRVDPSWRETRHPQEKILHVDDPIAIWKPSPEDNGAIAPVLDITGDGVSFTLTWTEASTTGPRIENYNVYRSVDGGEFELLISLPVTYDEFMAIISETLIYIDDDVASGHTYQYYVAGVDNYGQGLGSNRILLDALEVARITEDGINRLTEDGTFLRFIEAASRRVTETGSPRRTEDNNVRITEA